MSVRYGVILIVLILFALAAIFASGALGDAGPLSSPSPSYSASTSSTEPSRQIVIGGAWWRYYVKWQAQARNDRAPYAKARGCFGLSKPHALPQRPDGLALADWRRFGARCKRLAYTFGRGHRRLLYRLAHPAGSGAARWWPAASYVGWPSSQRANLLYCIGAESGGRPWAVNRSSWCVGLTQIQVHSQAEAREMLRPLANLARALRMWRVRGWQPWTTM